MKNFHYSSNNNLSLKGGRAVFWYIGPTALILLILSLALKAAGQTFLIVTAALFILVAAFSFLKTKDKGIILVSLVVLIFCIRALFIFSVDIKNAQNLNNKHDKIKATVISSATLLNDYEYGYCSVKVTESLNGFLQKGDKISFYANAADNLEIGDTVEATVTYQFIDKQQGIGFYSNGIYLKAFTNNDSATFGKSNSIYSFAGKIRSFVRKEIISKSDNYPVLLAMVTGDKGYITDNFYNNVINSGVSHILVVSGMHLVILCGGLSAILRAFHINRNIIDIIVLIFVFIMMCVCGFGMSIIRAGSVYLIAVIYNRISRRKNSLHSLCLALTGIILMQPFAANSVALQLSFASTLGILLLPEKLNHLFKNYNQRGIVLKSLINCFTVSLSAYIFTLPICVYSFGRIGLLAVPVNILVGIPSNFMISFCVLGLALGFIPFLSKFLIMCADIVADYFNKVVLFAGGLSYNTVNIKNGIILSIIITVLIIFIQILKFKPIKLSLKR